MKVEIVKVHEILPRGHQRIAPQSENIPILDAWYAYRRTVPTIYFFKQKAELRELVAQLVESLSHTLDIFPRFVGTLATTTQQNSKDDFQGTQRTVVEWGGSSDRAVEFTEARTKSRIQSLLPPTTLNESTFLWDYSPSSLRALFPTPSAEPPGIRIQITTFACGGFSLGIDFEHGLADGYTAGKFLDHWSTIYGQRFHGGDGAPQNSPSWQSGIFSDQLAEIDLQEHGPALLEKARSLPTRTPYRRTLQPIDLEIARNHKPETMYNYLLHVPAKEVEHKLGEMQSKSPMRLTDQAALIGFFWSCLNRARAQAQRPPIDLHLASSFRWLLGVRDGLLGSPFVVVMISPDADSNPANATDPIKLAVRLTETLGKYDDDTMHAITYDATFSDSPSSTFKAKGGDEHVEFSSVAHLGYDRFHLGPLKPSFYLPSSSIPNLFVLTEAVPNGQAVGNSWYKNGLNLFFNVTEEVFEAFTSDPALAQCEVYQDV
ncbi:transferase family protein [Stemphylium lycopersici]|uniref:Transferase family protein n=1 Tax=Stemphylium lycopersici TaxID=183478 RepID=A0A364NEU3_STELY|nr:transferase family protein [Stemphylium lycopersici]RAR06537.1 transferase family protein [Stemphylium lycopersici]RAR15819.1 transferase family protein [Stemphylium lycopersici]